MCCIIVSVSIYVILMFSDFVVEVVFVCWVLVFFLFVIEVLDIVDVWFDLGDVKFVVCGSE